MHELDKLLEEFDMDYSEFMSIFEDELIELLSTGRTEIFLQGNTISLTCTSLKS